MSQTGCSIWDICPIWVIMSRTGRPDQDIQNWTSHLGRPVQDMISQRGRPILDETSRLRHYMSHSTSVPSYYPIVVHTLDSYAEDSLLSPWTSAQGEVGSSNSVPLGTCGSSWISSLPSGPLFVPCCRLSFLSTGSSGRSGRSSTLFSLYPESLDVLIFLVIVLLVVPVGLVRGGGLSAETPQMKSKIYVQQANQDNIVMVLYTGILW